MKKFFVGMILMMLILSVLVACATEETAVDEPVTQENIQEESADTVQQDTSEKKPLKIFMTNAYYTAPYCAPLNKSASDKAKELGVELQIVDGEANAQKQLDQIKAAITEGVDGIIYFPADAAATPPVVDFLNESGVPYIILNTTVDESVEDEIMCYVGCDFGEIGDNLAEMTKEVLGNEGNIVIIEGTGGSNFTIVVSDRMDEGLQDTNIKILSKQQADWDPAKAMKITEDFLTKFGEEIDLIVAHDGGMFQGAASALEAAGLLGKIPVIATGNDMCVYDALVNGTLYATSTQDPVIEGALGVETIVKIINGENTGKWIKVPVEICYPEDVEKYNWF